MTARPFTPAQIARAVQEWVAAGCAVKIFPDGTVEVKPATEAKGDDPAHIDWGRK